jgi:hypothetical protein
MDERTRSWRQPTGAVILDGKALFENIAIGARSGEKIWRMLVELRRCMNLLGIYHLDMRLSLAEVWV